MVSNVFPTNSNMPKTLRRWEMNMISSFDDKSYALIVETITRKVETMTDRKEIPIIACEPIGMFLNLGTIINPIPMIKMVRPLSTRNIRCRPKTDPLIIGIFAFNMSANHMEPIIDPARKKIAADTINGLTIWLSLTKSFGIFTNFAKLLFFPSLSKKKHVFDFVI
jgi:hypothetical protein